MGLVVMASPAYCFLLALAIAIRPSHWRDRFAGLSAAVVILASGVALAAAVLDDQTPTALDGHLRADALSAQCSVVLTGGPPRATHGPVA